MKVKSKMKSVLSKQKGTGTMRRGQKNAPLSHNILKEGVKLSRLRKKVRFIRRLTKEGSEGQRAQAGL